MVSQLKRISRALAVALCLAAGLLSIANMDDALMQDHSIARARLEARLKAKANLSQQLAKSESQSRPSAAVTAFHQSCKTMNLVTKTRLPILRPWIPFSTSPVKALPNSIDTPSVVLNIKASLVTI